jgi:hypothetical protein
LLNARTEFTGRERPLSLDQQNTTNPGKAGLAAICFAIHQVEKFIVQKIVAEQISEANDGLLHCSNALHNVGALLQKIAEFLMCRPNDLLHVFVAAAETRIAVLATRHTCPLC